MLFIKLVFMFVRMKIFLNRFTKTVYTNFCVVVFFCYFRKSYIFLNVRVDGGHLSNSCAQQVELMFFLNVPETEIFF